ncbi:hypothetical protein WA026_010834 [Henosepilachna vigintioctopunctata]|uniref:RING-type domain-containing protein n=1 Tax=Henosepilachna vigintioctopunctata TaxID=420089 RepID=A0AAW1UQ71_9CUCU
MANNNDDDDEKLSITSSRSAKSKDGMKPLSNFSIMKSRPSAQSITLQNRSSVSSSMRRINEMGGGRRAQKRISKIQEITVITSCERDPDVCVLCSSGIPSTKCISCNAQGHIKCIEAFFCTVDKKLNLNAWQCPKCVTMNNLKSKDKSDTSFSLLNEPAQNVKLDCPFCMIDMNMRNCQCDDCRKGTDGGSRLRDCTCERSNTTSYKKCLHCRELGAVCTYRSLREDGKDMDDEDNVGARIMWSIIWFLLLVTLAFPIAIICANLFVFIHCFESCFNISYFVGSLLMKGMKLPGTCCRGICTGRSM